MTTGGLTAAFSASHPDPVGGEQSPGLRNSVSFNGINGDSPTQLPDPLDSNGPLRSDSLVDVLHRRFYSHQYMERTQRLVQVASFDNANAFLNSSENASPDGLHANDLRKVNHSYGTFPKSKSMNDASCRQGFSATVVEACRWLIEAGFPQYAQMFDDGVFPLDLATIREDHYFMDEDALSALFRRINTLNECVIAQRKDHHELAGTEESLINRMGRAAVFESPDGNASEEYALSRHWQFERDTRRWSRIDPDPAVHCTEAEAELESESRRSRTAKRPESPASRSLLRSASLRLRSAVSRFRRGDLNFRSLRRSKKATGGRKAQACQTDTFSTAAATSNHSASSSGTMATSPNPVLPSSASAHRILVSPASRLGPQTSGDPGVALNLERRHSTVATSGSNGNATCPTMQILVNDTIDTGSGDKINIRTGSFMGRAGHRHETYLRRRLEANNNNNNNPEAPTPKVLTEDADVTPTDDGSEDFRAAEELDRILQALYTDIDMLDEMMDAAAKDPKLASSSPSSSSLLLGVPSSGESGPSTLSDAAVQHVEDRNMCNDLDSQIVELKRLKRMKRTGDPKQSSFNNSLGHNSEQGSSFESSSSVFRNTTSTLRRNVPSRWSSIERNYRQSVYQQDQTMSGMSVKQLILLRKIALLKLTTIMEKHCPTHRSLFSWVIPKLLRRGRSHSETDMQNKVFNVPLATIFQRFGRLLPPAILNALDYLRAEGISVLGLFRRAGSKSRTLALKEQIEKDENWDDFSSWHPYDVADLVKVYFRELPECLLTNKLSSTLINLFTYLPPELRLEALQWAILRLPDENRMVLQSLLHFLKFITDHSEVNQMNATNLAVCLQPSLFNFPNALPSGPSPNKRRVTGSPDLKDLAEQKDAHECLAMMIQFANELFLISENILSQCQFDADELGEAPTLNSLAPPRSDSLGRDWQTLAGVRLTALLRDCRDRGKGWVHASGHSCPVEIHHKKINDGHPLKLWRCAVDVEAPPQVLLHRLWSERPKWDPSVMSQEVLEHLGEDADVVHLTFAPLSPPHPARQCVVLRMRQRNLEGGACALLTTSTTHESSPSAAQAACHPVFVMQEDILVDPCGSGKCRVHWLSRVDLRGFTAEWYGSSWSHCMARVLQLLQRSFSKSIDSRETRL